MFSLCDQINFKSKRNKLSSSLHSSCHFVSRVCAKTNEAIWYAKIGGWFHSSSSSWGRTWAFSWRWASPRVNTQSNLISGTLPSSTRECAERDLSPSWGENPSLVIRSGKNGTGVEIYPLDANGKRAFDKWKMWRLFIFIKWELSPLPNFSSWGK